MHDDEKQESDERFVRSFTKNALGERFGRVEVFCPDGELYFFLLSSFTHVLKCIIDI